MTKKKKLSDSDFIKIKRLSESFTKFVLDKIPPKNMCFQTSYPLYLLLQKKHRPNFLNLKNGTCESRNHFWLELEEIIIDPTITQFDFAKDMAPLYIGFKPCCFSENQSFVFPIQDNPSGVVQTMSEKLLLNFKYERDGIPKLGEVNLDDERKLILKAAIFIDKEIDIRSQPDYFDCVKQLLSEFTNAEQLSEFSKIDRFDNLRLKVCGQSK